ncbi:MAG TPA: Abi-alpha family protein [Blastocatellia bacterium]|nr:Abi-alpha family protein [Blastocatellia bacterium]
MNLAEELMDDSVEMVIEVGKAGNAVIALLDKMAADPLNEIGSFAAELIRCVRVPLFLRWHGQFISMLGDLKEGRLLRPVQPKFLLGVIENASLENSAYLRERWAALLVAALDPSFEKVPRVAFIDILRQLEVDDVCVLSDLYTRHVASLQERPAALLFPGDRIVEDLSHDPLRYQESLDSLGRMRLIDSHGVSVSASEGENQVGKTGPTATPLQLTVCMTRLGLSFARACFPKSIS